MTHKQLLAQIINYLVHTHRRNLQVCYTVQSITDEDFELTTEALQKRAKHHFWKRWSREYLLELRDTHHQRRPKNAKSALATGDIVLIHDQDNPRGFLKLARVQGLITGRDGVVRGATLKVVSKSGLPTILQRPLQLLYPLEISSDPPTTRHY